MKKIPIVWAVLAMAILMTSCDGIVGYVIHNLKTDSRMRSYHYNEGVDDDTIRFVINNRNQMVLKAKVNEVGDSVIYDSGAGLPFVQFYTEETKPEGMKFYKVSLMGADQKAKAYMTTIPVHIETPMCIVEHFGNAMLVEDSRACETEPSIDAYNIIGFPGLDISPYCIDFTKNQMYAIHDFSLVDTTEYISVKCKFDKKLNVMFVYPVINGEEYECVFDTGNGGSVLILDAQRVENHTDADFLYEGTYGKAIGGFTGEQHFVVAPENTIEFAGQKETAFVVYLESNLAYNNFGLLMIKRFDWVIKRLYNEETYEVTYKMYARPHASDTLEYPKKYYSLTTADGTLKVALRRSDGNEHFKVGDQIISVNGEAITEENICYYYDLLTEHQDWSEYGIKVK